MTVTGGCWVENTVLTPGSPRDGPAHSNTGHTERGQTQPSPLICSLLSTKTWRGFERKGFRISLQSKFNMILLRKGSVLKDTDMHHAVPSTYLCHSELSGIWNDPRSSAGETPLWLAWYRQSQESRWRDRQRKGCNTEKETHQDCCGRFGDYIPFAVQFTSAHLCKKQGANKPQSTEEKQNIQDQKQSYWLSLLKRSSPQKILRYKMTSSPPYSACSSLQWGSRVWLLATQSENGFWRAQRWRELFACTIWHWLPPESVFSCHL